MTFSAYRLRQFARTRDTGALKNAIAHASASVACAMERHRGNASAP
jgi:hypothetical protein